MFQELIEIVQSGSDLTDAQMAQAMQAMMSGEMRLDDLVALLTALRDKGESVAEITAAARVMREHALAIKGIPEEAVDTCGTGGDNKGTFNISTAAAFVVAGAGVPVAKHGNRSVSSKSGSADVLEALGVNIELEPEQVVQCITDAGIAFFFARRFHPAMRHVAEARQKIGTRTIFNLLGPLSNPAGAKRQVIGVFAKEWCHALAEVLGQLGSTHVMVVHGVDGMDELTLTGESYVSEWQQGEVRDYRVKPEDLELSLCREEDLLGGDAEQNAHLLRGILEGYVSPLRDVVLLNAAAALVVAGRAADLHDGLGIGAKSIDQGKAYGALKTLVEVSQA